VMLAKLNSFATRDQRTKRHKVEIAISTAILLYICVRTCQCLLMTEGPSLMLQNTVNCETSVTL
jgi:hypothetical protein